MHITFERFQRAHDQDQFVLALFPGWFSVQSRVLSFLSPADGVRFLKTCIILLAERKDLFYAGSGFSVATPRVAPHPVLGQVGVQLTVWDQVSEAEQGSEIQSIDSSLLAANEEGHHAVEEEHTDNFWTPWD